MNSFTTKGGSILVKRATSFGFCSLWKPNVHIVGLNQT